MRFKNYKNKYTNDNVIHSIEDVIGMPFGDVVNREPELESQYRQIGLPTNSELNSSPNAVYVHAYTKADGTQVSAHWRGAGVNEGVNDVNEGVNNSNLQNALAPLLLPMILSQIPMTQNVQPQENIPTGYASDIDANRVNNYEGNETNTPVYAENGVLRGHITENVNSEKYNNVLQTIFNDYKGLEDPRNTILYAIEAFLTNYFELKDADTKKADKYFHARANYEAAQQGIVGSLTAKIISDLRELSDSYRNINEKKYSKEESEQDISEDQAANELGRRLGRENPTINAFETLKFLMPKGFPERYRHR